MRDRRDRRTAERRLRPPDRRGAEGDESGPQCSRRIAPASGSTTSRAWKCRTVSCARRSAAGSASELPDVLSSRGGRPFFGFPDFYGFHLGCRRSALGLVFDGVERSVSGSRDPFLDGMVGSKTVWLMRDWLGRCPPSGAGNRRRRSRSGATPLSGTAKHPGLLRTVPPIGGYTTDPAQT
jgi:hypothetical protein